MWDVSKLLFAYLLTVYFFFISLHLLGRGNS
jgi:hypothetical protein